MEPKVLIVEDETKYAYILEKYFINAGYQVRLAGDGLSGLRAYREFSPDVVIRDIMLPQMNGYEVAKKIRENNDTPIVMMSALSEEQDILKGYTLQIDDYVTKPFKTSILIAKVTNLLERHKAIKGEKELSTNIQVGDIKIIRDTMECFVKDTEVRFTKTEYKLLDFLMVNEGKTCTRKKLIENVWEDKLTDDRIIDTYVKKIRKMLQAQNSNVLITTVFGIGYKLEVAEEQLGEENK